MQISPCHLLWVTVAQLLLCDVKFGAGMQRFGDFFVWSVGLVCGGFFFSFFLQKSAIFKLKILSLHLIEAKGTEPALHTLGKCLFLSIKFGRVSLQF